MDARGARAAARVAPPKGILAAGHGAATMSARLAAAGLPPTGEHRRAFRELLVTTPGMAAGLTGVILAEETLGQRLRDGRTFPAAAGDAGLMTGVRVDTGRQPLPGTRTETITQG
ncbi:MAG: class I fructose-bisphosphate aldolase, partial [Streptosporangiales bacterium]